MKWFAQVILITVVYAVETVKEWLGYGEERDAERQRMADLCRRATTTPLPVVKQDDATAGGGESDWKAAESIDAVREELRGAIFSTGFHLGAAEFTGIPPELQECGRQRLSMLAEFGVRSGLISPEEGNDWLDGIWDRKPLGIVCNKWTSDDEEVVAGAKKILAEATA